MEKALLDMEADKELDMGGASKALEEEDEADQADGGEPEAPEADVRPAQAEGAVEDYTKQEGQQEPMGEIPPSAVVAAMVGAAAGSELDPSSSAEFSQKTSSRESGKTDFLLDVAQRLRGQGEDPDVSKALR
eukprot:4806436-Pyramimonas_sp.AAC.1